MTEPTRIARSEEAREAGGLAAVLELEALDRDLFRAGRTATGLGRRALYGGQVAAQALRAAGATVPDGRDPHSLHGYFLRPGQVERPVLFHVDRDRDGTSFSARHVRAVQDGEVIFSMLASFQMPEPGPGFDDAPTRGVPEPPTDIAPRGDLLIETSEITPTTLDGETIRYSDRLWVRAVGSLPPSRLVHACALAYLSDLGSGFGQLHLDGLGTGGPSIDHSLWFHEPIRADGWTLLELQPVKASHLRGVYQGTLRGSDGRLGVLITQETLLRPRPLDPELRAYLLQRVAARDATPAPATDRS